MGEGTLRSRSRLQRLIDDQVPEDSGLEYKAAAKLEDADRRTQDVTKAVSALANSAGRVCCRDCFIQR